MNAYYCYVIDDGKLIRLFYFKIARFYDLFRHFGFDDIIT